MSDAQMPEPSPLLFSSRLFEQEGIASLAPGASAEVQGTDGMHFAFERAKLASVSADLKLSRPTPEAVALLMVFRGRIALRQNAETSEIGASSFFFFDPSVPFRLIARGEAECALLLSEGEAFRFHSGYAPAKVTGKRCPASGPLGRCLAGAMRSVAAAASGGAPLHPLELDSLCEGLLRFASPVIAAANRRAAASGRVKRTRRDELILKAEEAILARISDPSLSAADIAREAGVTVRYLSRLYASIGGTLMDRVRTLRLTLAADRLASHRWCAAEVKQIGADCGFASPQSFGRAFRTRYGCTPGEWRAKAMKSPGKPEG